MTYLLGVGVTTDASGPEKHWTSFQSIMTLWAQAQAQAPISMKIATSKILNTERTEI